ncbi:YolD-like family protein [Cytobacillus horneckiae]|uniref:YolD-like family protein n=1 Tax=Cytobacillus horneckiae TaxID=549687 RepID=UPI0039A1BD07
MALRDRGKVKWQSAFMMPEHLAALKRFENDYYQEKKPILDQYEIESKIHYAIEFAFEVKLMIWRDISEEIKGRICRLDGINKKVYVDCNGSKEKVFFADVIGIEVEDGTTSI